MKNSSGGGSQGPALGQGSGSTPNDEGTQAGGVDMGGGDAALEKGMVAQNKNFVGGAGGQGYDTEGAE